MYSYSVYNMGLHSDVMLPELVASDNDADITVRIGPVRIPTGATPVGTRYHVTASEIYFWQENVGAFLVRDGNEIIVEPHVGVEDRVLRLFILGPSMGAVMHQRGRLVLHASSVIVDGGAVAFLGESGYGKSTTAAAFVRNGHPLVADDITPVRITDGAAFVSTGFPQLKLHPDAATAVGHAPSSLPRIHPKLEKRALRTVGDFHAGDFPLRAIYVLDRDVEADIQPLGGQDALLDLVRFSYSNRLLKATGTSASHMQQCAALVGIAPVRRLRSHTSLESLDELVKAINCDLMQIEAMRSELAVA